MDECYTFLTNNMDLGSDFIIEKFDCLLVTVYGKVDKGRYGKVNMSLLIGSFLCHNFPIQTISTKPFVFDCHVKGTVLGNIGPGSFLQTLLCSVHTATALGQYSPIWPSCSVSEEVNIIFKLTICLSVTVHAVTEEFLQTYSTVQLTKI